MAPPPPAAHFGAADLPPGGSCCCDCALAPRFSALRRGVLALRLARRWRWSSIVGSIGLVFPRFCIGLAARCAAEEKRAGNDDLASIWDTVREATSDEVKELRTENSELKEVVAEITLKNRILKKSLTGLGEGDDT